MLSRLFTFSKVGRVVSLLIGLILGALLLGVINWRFGLYVQPALIADMRTLSSRGAGLSAEAPGESRGQPGHVEREDSHGRNLDTKMSVKASKTDISSQNGQIPPALEGLITDVDELQGRHSDYIFPPCDNRSGLPSEVDQTKGFLGPFNYLENYKNPCWVRSSKTGGKHAGELECVPYFYLIAATKSGSTDLFWRIAEHPDVYNGRAKEIRWFDRLRFGENFHVANKPMPKFEDYLDFYRSRFEMIKHRSQSRGEGKEPFHPRVIGDGSPTYFYGSYHWPEMPGNEGCTEPRVTVMSHIHHLYPKAKLILVLRDPVTRLLSTYLFNDQRAVFNGTSAQFDEWVRQAIDHWHDCRALYSVRYCLYSKRFIDKTQIKSFVSHIYSRYILDLLKIFPRDQIYFIHLESYANNVKRTLKDVFKFLELPQMKEADLVKLSEMKRMNEGRNYDDMPKMWPSTRRLLQKFFAPFNAELSAIMGGDPRWLWESSS